MREELMLTKTCNLLFMTFLYPFTFFIKRNHQYVAFGSWSGELFVDNSYYLAKFMEQNEPDLKIFWVGKKKLKKEIESNSRIKFLEINTFKSSIILMKCKYMFCAQMHISDLSFFNVFRGSVICYLHHGVPVKKWAEDAVDNSFIKKKRNGLFANLYHSYLGIFRKYEFFVTSSPLHDIANTTALNFRGCTLEKNIHSGTQRNDILINYDEKRALKNKELYSKIIGFDIRKKIIMYLPTFRRTNVEMFSFLNCNENDKKKVQNMLSKYNSVILEKSHFAANSKQQISGEGIPENVFKVGKDVNLQEMLLFTDIVVSDYSGAFLDFILLDRPVIHFAYDHDYYKNVDSGLYYEIEDFSAGKITKTLSETLEELDNLFNGYDRFKKKREYVRKKYMTYETGHACEKIVRTVIYGEKLSE